MEAQDVLIGTRAVHFAATLLAAGVAFFFVFVAAPAWRDKAAMPAVARFRARLLVIAWISLTCCIISGVFWLLLTAQSMSGEPLAEVLSQGVIWTVLTETDFGNDWLLRLVAAVLLGATFGVLLPAKHKPSRATAAAAVALAAGLAGSLAWAGHAIGAAGSEGVIHPAADVLHLIAAAAWVGTLPLLAWLFATAEHDAILAATAPVAASRYSTLGLVSVGTLLASGIVNSWYLVGSVAALRDTAYGQLLVFKIALFFGMVAIAAVNRLACTPRLGQSGTAAPAIRQLRRNAAIETLLGFGIVAVVAVLGTEPPGSHANHHAEYGALPANAAFVHIHSGQGMADVMILPGQTGPAQVTIHLWDDDFAPLAVRQVTVAVTAPGAGRKPATRAAAQDADGAWQAGPIDLTQPGNWTVTVDAVLASSSHLVLEAPIVIEAGP